MDDVFRGLEQVTLSDVEPASVAREGKIGVATYTLADQTVVTITLYRADKDIWATFGIIRSEGVATIVVDKDFRALSRVADRMVMLSKGVVVFDGSPSELAAKQDMLEQHLGV